MSTLAAPPRPPTRSHEFVHLLRAEFTKFRTIRAWVLTLSLAAVLTVAFAWIGAKGNHFANCPPGAGGAPTCTGGVPSNPVGPGGEAVVDTYSFVHQPLTGDGTLTAQVASLQATTTTQDNATQNSTGTATGSDHSNAAARPAVVPWAKAGIIITENTRQGSAYAAVMVTPGHGVRMQYDYTHDSAGLAGTVTASSPRWLRLVRSGDLITGYDSRDGIHWTSIGVAHLTGLSNRVQVGLFDTSPPDTNGSSTVATAAFDNVNLHGEQSASGWGLSAVGADTQTYPTSPGAATWSQPSPGAFRVSGSGDIAPQVAGGNLGGMGFTKSLLAGGTFGLIALIVIATLFITSEYRRGLIRTTLLASPRRGRMLAAKSVVIASVTFAAATIATSAAVVVSRHELTSNGDYLFPLSAATAARVVVGTGLLFAIAAVGVLAVATVFRRSAGAVVTGIALLVLPFIIVKGAMWSPGLASWLMRITPAAAFAIQSTLPRYPQVANAYTMANGYYPLRPWTGLAVLGVYSAAAFAAALWVIRRRDA